MKPFDPQLSQEDLAEMIDREGLAFEFKAACTSPGSAWNYGGLCTNAHSALATFGSIRLAPGALTEFGLKPGMVPHNPDGLTAEQLTEGGKWRAWSKDDYKLPYPVKGIEQWCLDKGWQPGGGISSHITHRVPVNTPFPKLSRTEPPAEQSSVTQQAGQSLTPESFLIHWENEAPNTAAIVRCRKTCGADHCYVHFSDMKEMEIKARTLETELTAALAQRDEANRLLREAVEMISEAHYPSVKDNMAAESLCTQITNHLKP